MSTSGFSSLIDASNDLWDHVKKLFIDFANFLKKTIDDLLDEVIKRLGEVFREACNFVQKLVEEGAEYFKKILGNEEHGVKEKVVVNMGIVLNSCQEMVLEELNRIRIEQGKPPVDWKTKSMKEIEEALKEINKPQKSSKPSMLAALPDSGEPHIMNLAEPNLSIDKDFVEQAMSIFEGLNKVRSFGFPHVS